MRGFELAKRIWQKDATAKIAFMSAYEISEKEALVNFRGLRTVHFIPKPVTAAALTEILRQSIEEPKRN
jgi:DNA-binding LytR/AlgR family response regulator